MPRGILHQWSYLAFHSDVSEKLEGENSEYLDKIIERFTGTLLKTEKLSSTDGNLFSFRLNDKARVICTVTSHEEKECLVVLEILPNHEYDKSKYLNGKFFELSSSHIKIVATTEEAQTEVASAESSIRTLPEIHSTWLNNKPIILGQDQVKILEEEVTQPTIFKISGVAGSGKTTVAELIMSKEHAVGRKVLYVTKSAKLTSSIKHKYEEAAKDITVEEGQAENLDLSEVTFLSYRGLCSKLIYDQLFSGDNLKHFQKSTKAEGPPNYQEVSDILNRQNTEDHTVLSKYLSEKLCDI